jgi:3-hydroxyisobutyrate dehydrogenase-like beta-hydroxyacid dehydrogenase
VKNIAIVGVGLLGSAVAGRLLQAGFQVSGYDTRPEQVRALAAQGLRAAGSIAEAVQGAEAVFTILPTLDSAEAVMSGPGGLAQTAARGTVILQMSTLSPELVQRLAQAAEAHGLPFLDTPMSGTSGMVARGDCTVLVGGDEALMQRCLPVLSALGTQTIHMGPVGAAALAKLVTNLVMALNTAALAEGLVLAAKGGLAPAAMLALLRTTAASSRMLEIRGPMMESGQYPAQMKLELFLKDLRLMLEAGRRLGVALPLTETGQRLYQAAAEAGHAAEDLAVIKTALERMAGMAPA